MVNRNSVRTFIFGNCKVLKLAAVPYFYTDTKVKKATVVIKQRICVHQVASYE